ncbi:MAG: transposase family protein [bacterium]
MQHKDYLTELLGCQGFFVVDMEIRKEGDIEKVILFLNRERKRYICSGCKRVLTTYYDSRIQEVRHLHLWKYPTVLVFEKKRVNCPNCGIKTESLEFLERYARITKELAHQTSELCKVMTIEDVSNFTRSLPR